MSKHKLVKKKSIIKCPYEKTISIIGSKWNLMILKEIYLQKKSMRFNQLMRSLKPISSKTLSTKLKELVKAGILERIVIPESPVIINYELTEKGRTLNHVLDAMADWSLKWNMISEE